MITVLVDNESWILPYAAQLVAQLQRDGLQARLVRDAQDIEIGQICFLLGCVNIVPREYLKRNIYNLVVHESALPKGRGFAPMTWQILEGKSEISVCLLDASSKGVDEGDVWIMEAITLDGDELHSQWREKQGNKTVEMCLRFVMEYKFLKPIKQLGIPTWYKRRSKVDSELDPNGSIASQWNLLRVVDNDKYPAYVKIGGKKFYLRIEIED